MSTYYQILIAAVIAVIGACIYVLVWVSLWKRTIKSLSKNLQNTIWDAKGLQDNLRRTVETVEILKRSVLNPKTPQDEEFIKTIDAQIARQKQHEYEALRQAQDNPKRRKLDQ